MEHKSVDGETLHFESSLYLDERGVLIVGVSAFQGKFSIAEQDTLIIGTFKSFHIIKVSIFQECLQGEAPVYYVSHTAL